MHAHIVPGSRVYCRVSHRQHITVGCQLRTLSRLSSIPTIGFNTKRVQKGHVTLKWSVTCHCARSSGRSNVVQLGSRWTTTLPTNVGAILPGRQCDSVGESCVYPWPLIAADIDKTDISWMLRTGQRYRLRQRNCTI